MRDLLGWILGWFGRGKTTIVREVETTHGVILIPASANDITIPGFTGLALISSSEGSIPITLSIGDIFIPISEGDL